MSLGVPIKLLHESAGHVVTCELTSGAVYRGTLIDTEENMNIQLKDVTVTQRDGRVQQLEQVYIRGSHVRFMIVPDILAKAPMFKNIGPGGMSKGPGLGTAKMGITRNMQRKLLYDLSFDDVITMQHSS